MHLFRQALLLTPHPQGRKRESREPYGSVGKGGRSAYPFQKKKERKKSLSRGHVKDIGSTVGIQSYRGQGYEGGNVREVHCELPALPSLRDGCALRGACRARPMSV
jgi:hypothetical protein